MVAALLSSGLVLGQPASTGDAVFDPVDPAPGAGMSFTLGAGAGAAPDYEGSDDYDLVPLWNLRVGNLYHTKTFVQVIGPRLRSNFLPSDHWRLGLAGQFIKEHDDVGNDQVDDRRKLGEQVAKELVAKLQEMGLAARGRQGAALRPE